MRKILSEKEAAQRIAAARKAARAGYAPEATEPTEPHIVQSGTWWKVMGADGHQVGTAKRTEAEAQEALDALTGG